MTSCLLVNKGKDIIVSTKDYQYGCFVLRTPLITEKDNLETVIRYYIKPYIKKTDIVFISEKIIAILQNRAIPVESIQYGFWAKFLSGFVTKSSRGIGLGMPETMQCAINEAGILRILFASLIGGIGKLFHQRGWFYRIAGRSVAAIDGPCNYTIPPYNRYVVLGPSDPDWIAETIQQILKNEMVLIVDCNDFGVEVLGRSGDTLDDNSIRELLKQNPLGQSREQTPVGILRKNN